MSDLRMFQVSAFASKPFEGNPAAVAPLEGPSVLSDALMQAIAAENNLSETAYFWPEGAAGHYRLRWFTPAVEVDLCGHATLASAWVAFEKLGIAGERIHFETRSGALTVDKAGDALLMDLPALEASPASVSEAIIDAIGARPMGALKTHTLFVIFEDEKAVRALKPDFGALSDALGREALFALAATAPADPEAPYDVVARFFAPTKGVPEDPVTGSLWAALAPIWAEKLGRDAFIGHQASARGGTLHCTSCGPRTLIKGSVVPYLEGVIRV